MEHRDQITEACLSIDYTSILQFDHDHATRLAVDRIRSDETGAYDLVVTKESAYVTDAHMLRFDEAVMQNAPEYTVPGVLNELLEAAELRRTRIAYGLGRAAFYDENEHQIWELYEAPSLPTQIGAGLTIHDAFDSARLYLQAESIAQFEV